MEGGAQERNQRAGTENVASIVAMGAAIELAVRHLNENVEKIAAMRDRLTKRILEEIPYTRLNGCLLYTSFPGWRGLRNAARPQATTKTTGGHALHRA